MQKNALRFLNVLQHPQRSCVLGVYVSQRCIQQLKMPQQADFVFKSSLNTRTAHFNAVSNHCWKGTHQCLCMFKTLVVYTAYITAGHLNTRAKCVTGFHAFSFLASWTSHRLSFWTTLWNCRVVLQGINVHQRFSNLSLQRAASDIRGPFRLAITK